MTSKRFISIIFIIICIFIVISIVLMSGCEKRETSDAKSKVKIAASPIVNTSFASENLTQSSEQDKLKNQNETKNSYDSKNIKNITKQGKIKIGLFEVCDELLNCTIEQNINKIKKAGFDYLTISVIKNGFAQYPSRYIPANKSIPQEYLKNYLKNTTDAAHGAGLRVYALIELPHEYWLKKNPDWISILSDGKSSDYYQNNSLGRNVPPSRVISEATYLNQLKGIINELLMYGVDGINVEGFYFPSWYLPSEGKVLSSSFDNFTVNKFSLASGFDVRGERAFERVGRIEGNAKVNSAWLKWRTEQVSSLLKLLSQFTKYSRGNAELRAYLPVGEWVNDDNGVDYAKIINVIDDCYVLLDSTGWQTWDHYERAIVNCRSVGAKKIFAHIYTSDISSINDLKKLRERIMWASALNIDAIDMFEFEKIEKNKLWEEIEKVLKETIKQ